jgi:hypothetical protein
MTMTNSITLTRAQAIQRQKDYGTYCPELHPPIAHPSPLAGKVSIAQTYWLAQVLEEMAEHQASASKAEALEELADIIIFLQYLHFTITDEPFVLSNKPDGIRRQATVENLLKALAHRRKTWKNYDPAPYTCADWFGVYYEVYVNAETEFSEIVAAYEAKVTKNKSRRLRDWNNVMQITVPDLKIAYNVRERHS